VADGEEGQEVLFDTASMANYGALSKRNLDEQQAGARIAVEGHKKNPGDFVLWKLSSAEEPGWDSPWGRGRPGWHIECSVMSAHHLGETFDIHGGGLDLIFPHHENEIAQSCCAHGTDKMANLWLHNGFVQVEGRKMSKSEGNFVTIHDVLHTEKVGGRKWPGEVVRLALLMTHYREPLDFSVKRLEEARNILLSMKSRAAFLSSETLAGAVPESVVEALGDDLNTVAAVQALRELAKNNSDDRNSAAVAAGLWFLGLQKSANEFRKAMAGLGEIQEYKLKFFHAERPASLDELEAFNSIWSKADPNKAITDRLNHLAEKNWAEADRIRDELLAQGIQLQDYKDPETGERKTKWEVKR
jgi:cysteinyl-tRNA synthetase